VKQKERERFWRVVKKREKGRMKQKELIDGIVEWLSQYRRSEAETSFRIFPSSFSFIHLSATHQLFHLSTSVLLSLHLISHLFFYSPLSLEEKMLLPYKFL